VKKSVRVHVAYKFVQEALYIAANLAPISFIKARTPPNPSSLRGTPSAVVWGNWIEKENKADTTKLRNLYLEMDELGRGRSPPSMLWKVKPSPQVRIPSFPAPF
jgi:hypothetical protein